jgi:transcription elongation factor GreA
MARRRPEIVLKDMLNSAHQTQLLSIVQKKDQSAWIETATQLIFTSDDLKLIEAIAERLQDAPDTLRDIYHTILAMPKRYPRQFQWMLKRIQAGKLNEYMKPTLIPKLIDTLEYVRGVKATIKSILSLANFDAIISDADIDEARRINDAVRRSNVLPEFDKKNYTRIIEHYFPDLVEEKTDVIYATQTAFRRRKQELEHILSVEIPKNKKEIGRAREFGDLSENFEYKAAKEKQDQLYEKARNIEAELHKVQLIEQMDVNTDRVAVGTLVDMKSEKDGSVVTYKILGRWDTDLNKNTISNEAPLARMMLGGKIGGVVNIDGAKYTITKITKVTDL